MANSSLKNSSLEFKTDPVTIKRNIMMVIVELCWATADNMCNNSI